MKERLFSSPWIASLLVAMTSTTRGDVISANFSSPDDVPVTAAGYLATGNSVQFALDFAPPIGTSLTVVDNTELAFIDGEFDNLAHGDLVTLEFGGEEHVFVANYFGGTGNDLVLEWPYSTVATCGWIRYFNPRDKSLTNTERFVDERLPRSLVGKTIIALAAGNGHQLALCSDGALLGWGSNNSGQLGDGVNSTANSIVEMDRSGVLSGKLVVAIACGANHSLALCSDGTLAAWGYNYYGQLGNGGDEASSMPIRVDQTGGLSGKDVVAISAGGDRSLVLCSDGTLAQWGDIGEGSAINGGRSMRNPIVVDASGALLGKRPSVLSTGTMHHLVLCADGTVVSWGWNHKGQLGDGSSNQAASPVLVDTSGVLSGRDVIAISAGGEHSLAVCMDGAVTAWGRDQSGQLGNDIGSSGDALSPILVESSGALAGKRIVAVSAGENHSLALSADGEIFAWGENDEGQLGYYSRWEQWVPESSAMTGPYSGKPFASILAGRVRSLGLVPTAPPKFEVQTSRGRKIAAGDLLDLGSSQLAGIRLNEGLRLCNSGGAPLSLAAQVPPGDFALDGIMPDVLEGGACVPLGLNFAPGDQTEGTRSSSLEFNVAGPGGFEFDQTIQLAATVETSTSLTVALPSAVASPLSTLAFDASPYTVQFSLGFSPDPGTSLSVIAVAGLEPIVQPFQNLEHGAIVNLEYDGRTYPFMANYRGGDGNDLVLNWLLNRPIAWGWNGRGQLGNGTFDASSVPVAVDDGGVLAGRSVVQVASGVNHALALCADGTVVAWGENFNGQLGDGTTEHRNTPVRVLPVGALEGRRVVSVSAGDGYSVALCLDCSVASWGAGSEGQLGNGRLETQMVPVAVDTSGDLAGKKVMKVSAGDEHCLAICSDGSVVGWGRNFEGVLGEDATAGNSSVPLSIGTGDLAGRPVVEVSAGRDQSLALCADGTLVAWGYGCRFGIGHPRKFFDLYSGRPISLYRYGVLAGKEGVAISAGDDHGTALCADGSIVSWGASARGDGIDDWSAFPVLVDSSTALEGKVPIAVDAGWRYSLAISADGGLFSWGEAGEALGSGSDTDRSVPGTVDTGSVLPGGFVSAISAGLFSAALVALPPPHLELRLLSGEAVEEASVVDLGVAEVVGEKIGTTILVANTGGVSAGELRVLVEGDFRVVGGLSGGVMAGGIARIDVQLDSRSPGIHVGGLTLVAETRQGAIATATLKLRADAGSTYDLAAEFSDSDDIPLSFSGLVATGHSIDLGLHYPPANPEPLTLVEITGIDFIEGEFENLGHGDAVTLKFGGRDFRYIANYFGGTGNDLVLVPYGSYARVATWGGLGEGDAWLSLPSEPSPADVDRRTALSGKSVISVAAGYDHCVALCSDGSLAAWGLNDRGQLGDGTTVSSEYPVDVDQTGALAGKTVIGVSAGLHFSVAHCSDGTAVAWGHNGDGELGDGTRISRLRPVNVNLVGDLKSKVIAALSSGLRHTLALCSDGSVLAWGTDGSGRLGDDATRTFTTSPVAVDRSGVLGGKTVVGVSAGYRHSLAVCDDGALVAWGYNRDGQLGDGTTTSRYLPILVDTSEVSDLENLIGVAGGDDHSLAVCDDGRVLAWGKNRSGQCGDGTFEDRVRPVYVDHAGALSDTQVVGVVAGRDFSLALGSTGRAFAWGSNTRGELGNGSYARSAIPVAVDSNSALAGRTLTAISAGEYHAVALDTDGNLVAWGNTQDGQLGNGVIRRTDTPTPIPGQEVFGASAVFGISAGYEHSLALLSDGRVTAWGVNYRGQLGNAGAQDRTASPVFVDASGALSGKTVVAISSGVYFSIALCRDGTLVAWGEGYLGNGGGKTTSSVPVRIDPSGALAGKKPVSVATSGDHCLVLCADGDLVSWGSNRYGQLGDGSTTDRYGPVSVGGNGALQGRGVIAISASGGHSQALCSDGTITTWGYNEQGQLGDRTTTSSSSPVEVYRDGVLSGATPVAIAAGGGSLALLADGTVASWGANRLGQLGNTPWDFGDGTPQDSAEPVLIDRSGVMSGRLVEAVATGGAHGIAICRDGTFVGWGLHDHEDEDASPINSAVPEEVPFSSLGRSARILSATGGAWHSVVTYSNGLPDISVLEVGEGWLADGEGTVEFDPVAPGFARNEHFIVRNPSIEDLDGLQVSITGSGKDAFSTRRFPSDSIVAGRDSVATIQFSPTASGIAEATLEISSSADGAAGPFQIELSGYAFTPLDLWYLEFFGDPFYPDVLGRAMDPNKDGEPNILEFLTFQDPFAATRADLEPSTLPGGGGGVAIDYTIAAASLGVVDAVIQWSETLGEGTWRSDGITVEMVSDDGDSHQMRATITPSVPPGGGSLFVRMLAMPRP